MASRVFSYALEALEKGSFPRARKWGWKRLYNMLGRHWSDDEWRFMNYGYIARPDQPAFPLDAADEPDRAFIGLYHQAVAGLDVAGKDVLEIGSGRGGGTSYIARYYNPRSALGIDFSSTAVQRARKLNPQLPILQFRTGDAEALPLPDESFDIVINVESSHCYGDMDAFVAETARVLRPGGIFSWADMRGAKLVSTLDRQFDHPALELIDEHRLSEGVVLALDKMNDRKTQRIGRIPFLKRFMLEFAGTKGSILYKGLKSGDVQYLARRYRKVT